MEFDSLKWICRNQRKDFIFELNSLDSKSQFLVLRVLKGFEHSEFL